MSNFTPGPWLYEPADSGDESVGMQGTPPYIYADPDDSGNVYPICTLDEPVRRADRELVDEYDEGLESAGSYEANALLIAAAPDLLEALQRARTVIEGLGCPVDTSITRAITKATGSTT